MLVGNVLTAAAYYALTAQLLMFAKRFQVGFNLCAYYNMQLAVVNAN